MNNNIILNILILLQTQRTMSRGSKAMSFDSIFDKLSSDLDDACPTEEQVMVILEELLEGGYLIERPYDDDSVIYEARSGLQWPGFVDLSNEIKKQILLYLVENPKTFFILYNTQKGKSKVCSLEMREWSNAENVKVVSVVIVDNDRTLAEQSAGGFLRAFPNVFTLSSNSKTKIDEILNYVSAYGSDEYDEYKMPVIVALQNDAQIKRVEQILQKIKDRANHPTKPSRLRYGLLFDEADKTYPPIRERMLPFIRDPVASHRVGFVTATDGGLLDLEDFEECCNAQMYQTDSDSPNYRAIHTEDSVVHHVELASKRQRPNDYAEMVIRMNHEHFETPIILPSGERYYRKAIVNGNTSVRDMDKFARDRVAEGNYAMTFNQSGIRVYRLDGGVERYKTKGKRLNEIIMYLYKKFGLNDHPLYIVGRRKVDRGLGFHYAPRTEEDVHLDVEGGITLRGGEGIVFTDLILGQVEDKNTAVQKSGRLAGIIKQCPQYPGQLHYWTNERTARLVVHHNQVVDAANALTDTGSYSALQAMLRAKEQTPEPAPTTVEKAEKAQIHEQVFDTIDQANTWCNDYCTYKYNVLDKDGTPKKDADGNPVVNEYRFTRCHFYRMDETGNYVKSEREREKATHYPWGGDRNPIETFENVKNRVENEKGGMQTGVNNGARIVPVKNEHGTGFKFVVIYKNHKNRV